MRCRKHHDLLLLIMPREIYSCRSSMIYLLMLLVSIFQSTGVELFVLISIHCYHVEFFCKWCSIAMPVALMIYFVSDASTGNSLKPRGDYYSTASVSSRKWIFYLLPHRCRPISCLCLQSNSMFLPCSSIKLQMLLCNIYIFCYLD